MKKTIRVKLPSVFTIDKDEEGYCILEGEEVTPEQKTLRQKFSSFEDSKNCYISYKDDLAQIAREHTLKIFDEAFQEYCRLPLNDKANHYPSKIDFIRSKLEHM